MHGNCHSWPRQTNRLVSIHCSALEFFSLTHKTRCSTLDSKNRFHYFAWGKTTASNPVCLCISRGCDWTQRILAESPQSTLAQHSDVSHEKRNSWEFHPFTIDYISLMFVECESAICNRIAVVLMFISIWNVHRHSWSDGSSDELISPSKWKSSISASMLLCENKPSSISFRTEFRLRKRESRFAFIIFLMLSWHGRQYHLNDFAQKKVNIFFFSCLRR